MISNVTIPDLPIGTGAALGSYLRSIYLTAAPKYSIIGFNINNSCLFEQIGNTSTLVSDIVKLFISTIYTIDDSIISESNLAANSDLGKIYKVTVNIGGTSELHRSDFSKIYRAEEDKSIVFSEPVDLNITFYICEVVGVIKESLSAVSLQATNENNIIPVACDSKSNIKLWHTIDTHKFTEDLTLHLEHEDGEAPAAWNNIANLAATYITKFIDAAIPQ